MLLKRNRDNKTLLFRIGWLAGILDGEGCISIRPNGKSWAYEVNITSTSKLIAVRCREVISGLGIMCLLKVTEQRHLNPNWSDKYNIRVIRRASILKLLEILYPHLVEKRSRAKLLTALLKRKEKRPHGEHYYTPQEIKLIEKFRALQRKPYKRVTLNQAPEGKDSGEGQTTRE